MPEETPTAPPGSDAAAAEQILREVDVMVGADVGRAAIVSDAVKASKRALERGRRGAGGSG